MVSKGTRRSRIDERVLWFDATFVVKLTLDRWAVGRAEGRKNMRSTRWQLTGLRYSRTRPRLSAVLAACALFFGAPQPAAVTSVVSDALEIERAESDRAIAAIVEQIQNDIWRVSIPGPSAAARPGVSTAPWVAASNVPPGKFDPHGVDAGASDGRFGHRFERPRSQFGVDHHRHRDADGVLQGPTSRDFDHLRGAGPHGLGVGGDSQLQRQLHDAIYAQTGDAFYGIFDYVAGWVDDGVVVLTGQVTHEYKASKMVEFVSRVEGVQEIQSQIEILPTSALDNRLRVELAKNIYGNPLFWNYAIQKTPSIRVIVADLQVTLEGVVTSEVDKRVAADIVRQTVGVLTFRNNLEIKSQISG